MEPYPIIVSLIEDDKFIRESLKDWISSEPGMSCRSDYPDCISALKSIAGDHPDVILIDIEMPGMSGIEGIIHIKKQLPDVDLIVYTVHENNELVFEALCNGAVGYLTKDASREKVMRAIREARSGGAPMSSRIARQVVASFRRNTQSPLSKRETEVLELLSRGNTYRAIGEQLFVDKETIKTHIKNIYQKLQVHSKAEAIEKALKDKLI